MLSRKVHLPRSRSAVWPLEVYFAVPKSFAPAL